METLPTEFAGALTCVEVSGDKAKRAQNAHEEVRAVLESDETLRSWGVDTVLIGSYSRSTGIYPGKDVDVFSRMTNLSIRESPLKVYRQVCEVLVSQYGKRANPQNRSIKIAFEGLCVDVVPAVQWGKRWGIPSREQQRWAEPGKQWIETDPERLGALTTERNKAPLVSGRGAYVPVVKLVRQARQHHVGDSKPGGLYFELATYWAFEGGVKGSSLAELLAGTLRSIARQLAIGQSKPLLDPALDRPYAPAPTPAELATAAKKFSQLAEAAERALQVERCPAAIVWRGILGKNGRTPWCFPLPDGCDEKGRTITIITPNSNKGSNEGRPFA